MTRWFRFYNDAVNDPKVQRLPGETFKAWVNLLCLASANEGTLPPIQDVAFTLRMPEPKVLKLLQTLVTAGLMDVYGDDYTPHNWEQRQFKSDASNERVKRYRERQCNVTSTVTVTPPETEAETEAETEQNRTEKGEGGADAPDPCVEAFALWNEMAERTGLPVAATLSDTRRSQMRKRLKEAGGVDGWKHALAKIEAEPFLRGENDRRWKADLDFLLRQSKFAKLMEGGYDRGKSRREMTLEALGQMATGGRA